MIDVERQSQLFREELPLVRPQDSKNGWKRELERRLHGLQLETNLKICSQGHLLEKVQADSQTKVAYLRRKEYSQKL